MVRKSVTQPWPAPAREVGVCFSRPDGLPGAGRAILKGGEILGWGVAMVTVLVWPGHEGGQNELTCYMSVVSPVVSWKILGQAHCSLLLSLLLPGSRQEEEGSHAAVRRRALHLLGASC